MNNHKELVDNYLEELIGFHSYEDAQWFRTAMVDGQESEHKPTDRTMNIIAVSQFLYEVKSEATNTET